MWTRQTKHRCLRRGGRLLPLFPIPWQVNRIVQKSITTASGGTECLKSREAKSIQQKGRVSERLDLSFLKVRKGHRSEHKGKRQQSVPWPGPWLAWLPVCFEQCEQKRQNWIRALCKAPGGSVSFSYQLLSNHYAHFLRAAPLGQQQMDIQLLPRGPESQSQGPMGAETRSSTAPPSITITLLPINMKASLSQIQSHLPLTASAWTQPTEKITFLLQGSEPTLDRTPLTR